MNIYKDSIVEQQKKNGRCAQTKSARRATSLIAGVDVTRDFVSFALSDDSSVDRQGPVTFFYDHCSCWRIDVQLSLPSV